MTLADLLTQNPQPTYEQTRGLALVFSAELDAVLDSLQAQYGDGRNVASAVELTDGRRMLCADLLTEAHEGGLYSHGFGYLPQERFSEVQVMPMADAIALMPQPEVDV